MHSFNPEQIASMAENNHEVIEALGNLANRGVRDHQIAIANQGDVLPDEVVFVRRLKGYDPLGREDVCLYQMGEYYILRMKSRRVGSTHPFH